MNNEYSSEEFITHINTHGRFIFINSKFEKIYFLEFCFFWKFSLIRARQFLGYNSFELIGRTFFDFVHPDDLPIIIRAHNLCKYLNF